MQRIPFACKARHGCLAYQSSVLLLSSRATPVTRSSSLCRWRQTGASTFAAHHARLTLSTTKCYSSSPSGGNVDASVSAAATHTSSATTSPSSSPPAHPRPRGAGTSSSPGQGLCFSQGLTDYKWEALDSAATGVLAPAIQHRETMHNRIRLFGMPKGFPDTTAAGFHRFFYLSQVNSFIADFSACIGYQSLLGGFFLGSSPQMWMLKDLFPALIAAYMANRLVSYENRPKQWFCVSVLLRNVTIVSDMVIPSAVPNHLVLAAIVTAVLKQSSALMFFVTRAAALQHYAIDNNLAELTKKFNSFSMVTFTFATALAIVYCTFLTSFAAQLTTILVCCVANMTLSYMAMSPIAFRILNFSTMELLARAYILQPHRTLTPQEASNLLGVRMSPVAAMRQEYGRRAEAATHLLYISPPVEKLLIRSDQLDEDVLFVNASETFLLALWKPTDVPLSMRESYRRYEMPALPKLLRGMAPRWRHDDLIAEMQERFGGHRLCLLVQHACTPKDLVTAYLIMYTAVFEHSASEESLRAFLKQCCADRAAWAMKGAAFYAQLKEAGWDVQLPALDHHDFRVSELIVPPSLQNAVPPGDSTR